MKLLAILPFLSISAVLARHAERASEDPLIYNINNVYQCGQPSIQWRTSAPPCNITLQTVDEGFTRMSDESHFHYYQTVLTNTSEESATFQLTVAAEVLINFVIVDSLGRNYTTYPTRVGSSYLYDDSCLAPDSPGYTPRTTSSVPSSSVGRSADYRYGYTYTRPIWYIIVIAISALISLLIVVLIIVICVCKTRKRRRLAEAAALTDPKPVYAQYIAYPGAQPTLYVQLRPNTPFAPVVADPGAVVAEPSGDPSTVPAPPMTQINRETPLSRGPSLHGETSAAAQSRAEGEIPVAGPSRS